MSDDNKIVHFPKGKLGSPPQSLEDIIDTVAGIKLSFIEGLSYEIMEEILEKMSNANLSIEEKETAKYVAFMTDSIKAAICKVSGVSHPLDNYIEDRYDIFDEGDGMISVSVKQEVSKEI